MNMGIDTDSGHGYKHGFQDMDTGMDIDMDTNTDTNIDTDMITDVDMDIDMDMDMDTDMNSDMDPDMHCRAGVGGGGATATRASPLYPPLVLPVSLNSLRLHNLDTKAQDQAKKLSRAQLCRLDPRNSLKYPYSK